MRVRHAHFLASFLTTFCEASIGLDVVIGDVHWVAGGVDLTA
jgi:hypothetical protein